MSSLFCIPDMFIDTASGKEQLPALATGERVLFGMPIEAVPGLAGLGRLGEDVQRVAGESRPLAFSSISANVSWMSL